MGCGPDGNGGITLRNQNDDPYIGLHTGADGGIINTRHLFVGGAGENGIPTVNIWTHSDYTYPNRTAFEVRGGVTDGSSSRYFRIYTGDGDPYTLKAKLDGRFISRVVEITGGSDLAEPFAVAKSKEKSEKIEPGMVVVIDPENPGQLKLAREPYDRKVAGIISGANGLSPGMVMNGLTGGGRPSTAEGGRATSEHQRPTTAEGGSSTSETAEGGRATSEHSVATTAEGGSATSEHKEETHAKTQGHEDKSGRHTQHSELSIQHSQPDEHPVALTGRVYVWADASYGAIAPGDMLTTSATPGHAMKAADREKSFGAVVGKAMEPLKKGKGLVLMLVSLQ